MKTLGVVANCGKPLADNVLGRLLRKADSMGLELVADPATAARMGRDCAAPFPELVRRSDVIMALGGDGTMLRVVREIGAADKPVIGVNIGSLGFMTSVTHELLEEALDCLAAKRYAESVRSIAECSLVRDGKTVVEQRALNDIVVGRGPSSRVVTLKVSVGDDPVTSYVCDGLIVSTPTGSTGHSLSAGGPILTPDARVFVVSLICPHTLSSRPLVVPDHAVITVAVENGGSELLLAVDGQMEESLQIGDQVSIRKGEHSVRFLHLPGYSYFDVLRRKLGWRGSSG
jgi:NAD+ kinase